MISVIIPVFNEERALPGTLDRLLQQPGDYEVLVVDGGSIDRTRDIVVDGYGLRLIDAPKGRASQMNAGARQARGDWLLFLHADTLLPGEAITTLAALDVRSDVVAGGFSHRFSGRDWRLRMISVLDNIRCRRTGVVYGDQAMFVRRSVFERLGGFPEQPIMEDVAFCERLVRQHNTLLLPDQVITNSRKFERHGIWRSLWRVIVIQVRNELGLPIVSRQFFEDVR